MDNLIKDLKVNPRFGPGQGVHKNFGNQPKPKELDLKPPS